MPKPEILTVSPVEAVEHFRGKGYHLGFDWRDTAAGHHLASFTVAKVAQLDILEDIREAVDEAIAEGMTFRQFQQRLEPMLQGKGWWGRREMIDPVTGERRLVQLGSPRRLRTIFDTNIRMARAHGRWTRVQRLKGVMPYLRYVAVLDARTRPEHALWHGTVLPVDHPWWKTHFPPNGWHCRCIVVQLSDDDLERYGYKVSPDPVVDSRPWRNRRTGEVVQVPRGMDPGFAHNVGLVPFEHTGRIFFQRLAGASPDLATVASAIPLTRDAAIASLDVLPVDVARERVRARVSGDGFRRHLSGFVDGDLPVAVLAHGLPASLGTGHTVRLSQWTAAKQLFRHPDLTADDYARVQRMLDQGRLFEDGDSIVAFLEEGGRWWSAVLKPTSAGELYLVTYHRREARQVRRAERRLRPFR
ncbi:MAG: head morphogenesis protein [Gammaproteobacteria bacterium]|nr:head morphogenesis protein [Gammaproteobacteria bacterium]